MSHQRKEIIECHFGLLLGCYSKKLCDQRNAGLVGPHSRQADSSVKVGLQPHFSGLQRVSGSYRVLHALLRIM